MIYRACTSTRPHRTCAAHAVDIMGSMLISFLTFNDGCRFLHRYLNFLSLYSIPILNFKLSILKLLHWLLIANDYWSLSWRSLFVSSMVSSLLSLLQLVVHCMLGFEYAYMYVRVQTLRVTLDIRIVDFLGRSCQWPLRFQWNLYIIHTAVLSTYSNRSSTCTFTFMHILFIINPSFLRVGIS